ncbi:MAG: conjugal transfer protein TraF, partial [Desulfobacteraceae bacterium]|nr:conjugal transfer protein TraF [Desulfobacteraceae bacterium]
MASAPAAAMDTFFATPRAMGMGGANVAAVHDTSAQYYNPAAFGFFGNKTERGESIMVDNNNLGRKNWGIDAGVSAGYRLLNDFGKYADTLENIDLERLQTGVTDQSDLENLVNLVSSLEGIAVSGSAVNADATAGGGFRAGHFALGGRGFSQAIGRVYELDTNNLGLDVSGITLANEIDAVPVEGFSSTGYQFQVFTSDQRDQLANALGVSEDAEAIQKLDYIAAKEGIESGNLQGSVDLMETVASSGDGSLDNNTTSVMLTGFGVGEAALSYGYAINNRWSVGGNLKFMRGRVYGNKIVVFDEDADEILTETDEKYEETNTFGIDLGVMARFEKFNFGIIGRNLNSPEFDGFTDQIELSNGSTVNLHVDDVKLEPQVTAGMAYFPVTTLALAADVDLIENETLLSGYESRKLSLGVEWDAFRVLALRAGAYRNLSESDIGWVYTAGLGLNLWAVRLDVAGAISPEEEEFDKEDVPIEGRLAAEISVDF